MSTDPSEPRDAHLVYFNLANQTMRLQYMKRMADENAPRG
jgi:hypothetical protein